MRGLPIVAVLVVSAASACGDNIPGNSPPTIVPTPLSTSEDVTGFVTLTVTDPDDDPIQLDVDGAMHGTPSATGLTIEYAPDPDFNGTDQITVTASDGEVSVDTVIAVTVLPVNDAPIAVEDSFAANEDEPLVIAQATLLANDIDIDGDILLLEQVAFPEDGTVTINGDNVTFTPDPNFIGDGAFEYVVGDGMATSAARVNIAVGGLNDPPVANDDTAVIGEDGTLNIPLASLRSNDTDADGQTLSITMVDNPSTGAVSIVGTDARFVPGANFNGAATFDYTVTDGAATDVGTVMVTVTPVADAPVAGDDLDTGPEDTLRSIPHATLLANDSDPDGTMPTISAVSNAMNGTVTLTATTVDFMPAPNHTGPAQFDYTITDGGLFDTATTIVTITPVNDPPIAVDDSATTPRDTPLVISEAMLLANDTDVDTAVLDVTAVGGAVNGSVDLVPAGSVTFTPNAGFTGMAQFEYTVFDGALADTSIVLITVTTTDTCGDNQIEGAEQCDDGDTDPGDGCSATCQIESGWTCTGEPSTCVTVCGDGLIRGIEACDDDDLDNNDGCSSTCTIETGWTCAGEPSVCDAICGDGLVRPGEGCDDSGTAPGDGCDAACDVESGWTCMGEPSLCATVCGDGLLRPGEACDDGGNLPDDGCDPACEIETGWTCTGEPSACDAICGDGMTLGDEECDDMNTTSGDGCTSTCLDEFCGDGVDNDGTNEACDDGDPDDTDGCTTLCVIGALCDDIAVPGGDRFAVDPATGHCYASFDDETLTFASSQLACVGQAGYLATITSAGENGLVSSVQNQAQNPWIGATDDADDTDNIFDWVTDEAFLFFTYATNEPDDNAPIGDGECLHLAAPNALWGDAGCDFVGFVIGRICEIEPAPCGDSIVQPVAGEECDDGNTSNGDGCSATCTVETPFFSEYVEGSGNNKGLEIRNPSNTPFDLAANGCSIQLAFNGSTTFTTTIPLTGTIAPDDVIVVCDQDAANTITPFCDILNTNLNFNGDDAVHLNCNSTVIDAFGDLGFDPGSEWAEPGVPENSTQDNTIRRRCTRTTSGTAITHGNTIADDDFNVDVAEEWEGFAQDTFAGLGDATCAP
jgi:cysteine-rich repeat protein